MPIQLGGGLRDADAVEAALDAGAERVVLGTAALARPGAPRRDARAYGQRVVVSVDARGGDGRSRGLDRDAEEPPPRR